jgi:hypothetical protein
MGGVTQALPQAEIKEDIPFQFPAEFEHKNEDRIAKVTSYEKVVTKSYSRGFDIFFRFR